MSGAFQRLVARATGAPTTGLRPRLPTLFEHATAPTGFEEIQHDTPSASPMAPQSPSAQTARVTPPSRQDAVPQAAPAAVMNEPAQTRHPAPLEKRRDTGRLDHTVGGEQPHNQPDPLLRQTPASFSETPPSDVSARRTPQATVDHASEAAATQMITEAVAAPAPLLPASAPHDLDQASTLTAAAAAHPDPKARASAEMAAAPEITIHIGQLDVRSEQPQPIAPQRPAPRVRSMPSLSDYLRGRGS